MQELRKNVVRVARGDLLDRNLPRRPALCPGRDVPTEASPVPHEALEQYRPPGAHVLAIERIGRKATSPGDGCSRERSSSHSALASRRAPVATPSFTS